MQKDIETTYISEGEDFCILCLEKRQQSSSAVMFARLRSNRRYKPGDYGKEARETAEKRIGIVERQNNYQYPAHVCAVRKSLKYVCRIALVAVPAAAQV